MAEGNGTNGADFQPPAKPPKDIRTPEEAQFEVDYRKAKLFSMSPLVPDHLRNGPPEQATANCYAAMTMARELRQNPLIVMQNIYFVKGKPGWNASYMIANANASGKFSDPIDWRVEGDGDNLTVTAFAKVKATGREVSATADMKMAKAEGWTSNTKYKSMPVQMLKYRSATLLVRLYAPEVMLGYHTAEELEDLAPAPAAAAHVNRVAALESRLMPTDPAATEIVDAEGEILNVTAEAFELGK